MAQQASTAEYRELEQLYANDPNAYRWRVRKMVWLGYGYVALCIALLLGFLGGGIALFASGNLRVGFADEFLRMGIPAVALAILMARGLFVRIPPPEGHYLGGDLKQAVLDWVEPLRQATSGCEIHDVILVDEINAAVSQRPRFGLFGPTTNALMIGTPLLELLDPDELKAVVAHEFGHLSHAHGRMGASVYRLDQTLHAAAAAIEEKAASRLSEWAFRFFHWFYSRFDTLTFAMRRGQEYEADRVATQATSADAIAASLCRLHAIGNAWSAYWSRVWSQTRENPDNSRVHPHRDFQAGFAQGLDPNVAAESVRAALEEETTFVDTHPCLRERLAAIGAAPVDRAMPESRALDAIFAAAQREQLIADLDRTWQQQSAVNWNARHRQYDDAESTLASLDARRETLDAHELLRLARLEETLVDEKAALSTTVGLVERFPDSVEGHYQRGRLEWNHDPESAERSFLACVERDPEWIPDVLQIVEPHYEQVGRSLDESPFAPHIAQYRERVAGANAERKSVNPGDAFVAARLTAEELDHLASQLAAYPEIRALDLVEKEPEFFANHRMFVMGVDLDRFHENVESKDEKWLDRVPPILANALPQPNTHFPVLVGKNGRWIETFGAIAGARVYERQLSAGQRAWQTVKRTYQIFALLVFLGAIGYVAYTFATR